MLRTFDYGDGLTKINTKDIVRIYPADENGYVVLVLRNDELIRVKGTVNSVLSFYNLNKVKYTLKNLSDKLKRLRRGFYRR